MSIVNGYEIAYIVTTAEGRIILKTLDRDKAVLALGVNPGSTLDTKAVGA